MAKKYVIGADVGGTNIRASLISMDEEGYAVISRIKEPTGDRPLETLRRLLDSLCPQADGQLSGIGLAVAGVIDNDKGIVLRSPNIQEITGMHLKSEVEGWYGKPVVIENDANAAAYGEKYAGAGRDFRNFVVITLGTGVGGGIVINNSLLPVTAEVGHMSIKADGEACSCGNLGCLELYSSATAIISNAVSMIEKDDTGLLRGLYNGNFYKINAEDIYRAALEGDTQARTVLREAGKSLGIGIANIINILSPEAVILTGGLIGAWNIYVEAAMKEASKRTLKELYSKVKIIPSSLGDDAGIVGAARLAFESAG